jgi:hypothetical protein
MNDWRLRIFFVSIFMSIAFLLISCGGIQSQSIRSQPPTFDGPKAIIAPTQTRLAKCVPYPSLGIDSRIRTATPYRGMKTNGELFITVTPRPIATIIDLSPKANVIEKAIITIYRCNGRFDQYIVGPDVKIPEDLPLGIGDTIFDSMPIGLHPLQPPDPSETTSGPTETTIPSLQPRTDAYPAFKTGQTTRPSSALKIVQLQMFSTNTGWALHADYPSQDSSDGKILRTINGVQAWKNVSPPIPEGYDGIPKVLFVNPDMAIAIYSRSLLPKSPKTEITIRRTTDGGQTWQTGDTLMLGQAPMMSLRQIEMLDQTHGWLLAEGDESMGKSSVTFFATQDGGLHWSAIYNANDHLQANDPNTLWGFSNYPYGDHSFSFITAIKGFYSNGELYFSQDGGKSWQKQQLPLLNDLPDLDTLASKSELFPTISLPQFETSQDGVLIERIYSREQVIIPPGSYTGLPQRQYLYFTHDGGQNWNSNLSPAKIGDVYFHDSQTGWFLGKNDANSSTPTRLYQTLNGGKTWKEIATNCPLPLGSTIQFIDYATGFAFNSSWAGSAYGQMDDRSSSGVSTIFATTDGGQTWGQVMPQLTQ